MAPARKHQTDDILDAARTHVLAEGPRAASVAAIAQASGAPVGTLYHRFASRDAILVAVWLRALERFQTRAMGEDAAHPDDPVDAAVAIAVASVTFAAEEPEDARLLLAVRRRDLLDGAPDDALRARLDAMNAPLEAAILRIVRAVHGRADARSADAVMRAVVDLPTAVVRRHVTREGARIPGWLAGDVADAVRLLLTHRRTTSRSS